MSKHNLDFNFSLTGSNEKLVNFTKLDLNLFANKKKGNEFFGSYTKNNEDIVYYTAWCEKTIKSRMREIKNLQEMRNVCVARQRAILDEYNRQVTFTLKEPKKKKR